MFTFGFLCESVFIFYLFFIPLHCNFKDKTYKRDVSSNTLTLWEIELLRFHEEIVVFHPFSGLFRVV